MDQNRRKAGAKEKHSRRDHFKRWGAAYLLAALFLGSWIGQLVFQLSEVRHEAAQHGQAFAWTEFWPRFLAATFENWQSEWLQLLVQAAVLLGMKHILFKADAEDQERMEAKLDAVLQIHDIDPVEVTKRFEEATPH